MSAMVSNCVTLGEMGSYIDLVYSSTFLYTAALSIYQKYQIRPLADNPCTINALYGLSLHFNTVTKNHSFHYLEYNVPNCVRVSLFITFFSIRQDR